MSRFYFGEGAEPQAWPPSRATSLGVQTGFLSLLPRTNSLAEIQTLIKEHTSRGNLGSGYGYARTSDEDLRKIKKKAVREYYENLNKQLDYFQEVDDLLAETTSAVAHTLASEGSPLLPISRDSTFQKREEQQHKVKVAININFIINVLLLVTKILVVIFSNSLSLLASAVDSAMDFLSTLIIFFTARASRAADAYKYPAGKHRLEPLGVTVFSVTMITSFAQVFVESVERLFDKNLDTVSLPLSAIIAMAATVGIKSVVWLAYRSMESASIKALAQDAKNDVVFNVFSLAFPFIGKHLGWRYLDPLGAMLLSIYIIVEWISTLWECISDLVGCRADPLQHQRVIYLVTRFSPLVKAVQYCNVYTAGGGVIVEIDVVLPSTISLPKSHDICESIQYSLESLEGINRAYVHADYKYDLCSQRQSIELTSHRSVKNPSGHHSA